MILGIDEVGRGCWAGPLVMGAVVLSEAKIDGLTDSKALSAAKREILAKEINQKAKAVGLGWVSGSEIDKIGLSASLVLACRRAVSQIKTPYHQIIIDGTINFLQNTKKGPYVTTLKKADLLIPAVSAASIAAKVARDNFMKQQAQIFPEYGFDRHVGYGTAKHRQAIQNFGACELHRFSIKPLHQYQPQTNSTKPTTKQIGDQAEDFVATKLENQGHQIIARNWRTKFCEIDIISLNQNCLYFTEVKYRQNDKFGGGLEAIGKQKLQRMKRATEFFSLANPQFHNMNQILLAADVQNKPLKLVNLIEITD